MVNKINLEFLKFTNKGHYYGELDFPEATCILNVCPIDYLAFYGEKINSKYLYPALSFYQYDEKFDGINGIFNAIYYNNQKLLSKFAIKIKDYKYVIGPDYSICGDAPKIENIYRIFKSRVVGSFLVNELNKIVIPNISFIDEETKVVALSGISKGSTIAISTKGLLKSKEKQNLLDYIVNETLSYINPRIIVLYNVAIKSVKLKEIITRIEKANSKVIIPPNKLLIRNELLEQF